MNMEHGEWVELATGDESVVGDRQAVVDGASVEVDPEAALAVDNTVSVGGTGLDDSGDVGLFSIGEGEE